MIAAKEQILLSLYNKIVKFGQVVCWCVCVGRGGGLRACVCVCVLGRSGTRYPLNLWGQSLEGRSSSLTRGSLAPLGEEAHNRSWVSGGWGGITTCIPSWEGRTPAHATTYQWRQWKLYIHRERQMTQWDRSPRHCQRTQHPPQFPPSSVSPSASWKGEAGEKGGHLVYQRYRATDG